MSTLADMDDQDWSKSGEPDFDWCIPE